MTPTLRPLALAAALLAGACLSPAAEAAESYDNCTGFIDTLPATISTQGVWCVRKHLATAVNTGNAITITAHNVTIDCNDFKIGGLAAGAGSKAIGIYTNGYQNVTVRACNLRGFYRGIWLDGSGHLVENNRLDGNLYVGIQVAGTGNRVQDNRILDTGAGTDMAAGYGIYAAADIVGNTVDTVYGDVVNYFAYGITATADGNEVRGNIVRGLASSGTGSARALNTTMSAVVFDGNRVSADVAGANGYGVYAPGAATFCRGNVAHGFPTTFHSCDHASGNLPVAP